MIAWHPFTMDDHVAPDSVAGDGSETWVFEGAEGLRRLSGPQAVSSPDPASFRGSLTRVQFDHVALEYFEVSPHTVHRDAGRVAARPLQLLSFIHLVEGSFEVQLPDLSFPVEPGESIVLDSRRPVAATAETETRVLRSVVGIEHVAAALRSDDATVPGVLPATPLMTSFAAFISAVLRSSRHDAHPLGPEAVAAVAELQSAVLAEAQQIARFPRGAVGLRYQIEALIQQHHTDPRLDVAAIARALDISVRHAHGVFNDGDRTIGTALRDRRVATAARLLRTTTGAVNLGLIAHDAGFTDRDVLTRAFTQHYGMTPAEYHQGGHRTYE